MSTSTPTSQNDKTRQDPQIDVADHPNVMLWMKDVAKKDPEGFLRLIGDNSQDFKKLWGKPTWTNDGSKGWTKGWQVYENNLHWIVLTGPSGSIFRLKVSTRPEDYLNDPKVGVGVIQYLNHLLKAIAH